MLVSQPTVSPVFPLWRLCFHFVLGEEVTSLTSACLALKYVEVQVGQFLLRCKCLVSRSIVV